MTHGTMKLCLGTVQLGMDYGIRGQRQPSPEDAVGILDYATQNGIDTIDTACAYGTAEDVVGVFLGRRTVRRDQLFVISKLRPNLLDGVAPDRYYEVAKANLQASLRRLRTDYLDAYMCHSARYVFNEEIMSAMRRLRDEGLVRHNGVSVYEPNEAMACMASENTDFMQLPFSVFDQRMLKAGVFATPQTACTRIHSRSAFIQGLVLMREGEVPPFLAKARPLVRRIDALCARHGISRIALAMGFVKRQSAISHLVFGVDNLVQLREDIDAFRSDLPNELVDEIGREFVGVSADIVMPSLWARD